MLHSETQECIYDERNSRQEHSEREAIHVMSKCVSRLYRLRGVNTSVTLLIDHLFEGFREERKGEEKGREERKGKK